MKRSISSSMTFIYKFLFSIGWIGGFGAGTVATFLNPELHNESFRFLAGFIFGTAFIYWACIRLKFVSIDEDKLYISNFMDTIEIEKNEVVDVTENVIVNIHPVWIHFKQRTKFGKSIMFMPKIRIFSFFSSHPIVEELKEFAGIRQMKN